jgi:UDP-N-acetylmuramate--alanine ligase
VGDIHWNGQAYPDIELPIPGAHQFMNAVAVFALATRLGINISVIREAFASFSGVSRRSERLLEKHGVSVIDDYGHTYEEIECTLSGIRRALPDRRLLAVFQPHRYTRAQQMLADPRATPFTDADHVMVTEVFSAGEEAIEGVDEIAFCRQIYAVSGQSCESVASVDLQQRLRQWVRPLDVLVFFGAGDITRHAHAFADFLEATPQMPKLKLALLYGGPSYEHAISLRSARFVEQSLDPSFYDIQCIALSETGQWRMDNQGSLLQGPRIMERRGSKKLPSSVIEALQDCDIAFPMMHGSIGEDGTIQSLLKILGVPHVGCDPTASALCMDKDLSKRLALASKVPTAPWVAVSREEWRARGPLIYQLIAQQMDGPVFVKPAHGGSSVGVVRAANEQELYAALVACFHLDDKLIVEHEVRGRQLEFAVLGFDQVEVSWPGEILLESGTIYDYEAKYSEHSARTVERAVLDEDLVEQGQELARRVFQCLGCAGMARVDFFLDEQERFFFNEVNPIPGFTDISLYPQMWAAQGLSIHDLLNRLIGAGLRRASTGAGAAAVTVQ